MFTGIIETTGIITNKTVSSANIELTIKPDQENFLSDVKKGSSIAVNGVCLTITQLTKINFSAFISTETFNITNLKDSHVTKKVNLEKALKINDRLDGHIVTGHIDDTAIVTGIYKLKQDYKLEIKISPDLLKYVINKGSIAVNGISLTIAKIKSDILSFSIIPETYKTTNIDELKTGNKVNIEVDMFAKYVENFLKMK